MRTYPTKQYGEVHLCNKAYMLENPEGIVVGAYRKAEDKVEFHKKYSVPPNACCEEHFIPVSQRYELT